MKAQMVNWLVVLLLSATAAAAQQGTSELRGRVVDDVHARQMPVNIVSNGVVTRSVRDTAWFLAAAEAHEAAVRLPRVGLVEGPSDRRRRIGLVVDSITGTPTDADTRAAVLATAETLTSLGHDVVEIAVPIDPRFIDAFVHYWSLLGFSTQRFGKRVMHPGFDASQTDPLTRYLSSRFLRQAWRTPVAIRTLQRSEAVYRKAFADDRLDAVLSPTLAHTTPRLGHLSPAVEFPEMFERLVRYVAFTPANNASGSPAVSLPLGRSAEGLPVGVQLSALHGEERLLLELSYELEAARPFARIQD